MNKVIKIVAIIFIIFTFFCISSSNKIYAQNPKSVDDIISGADGFVQNGTGSQPMNINAMKTMSDTIYNVLLVLAIVVAVIVGLVIGVKFMTGSVSEKAQVKETLIPYIAGCVVIFGAFAIWKFVVEIMKTI